MKIILEYHMIDDVDCDYNNINIYPDYFEQQICYLKNNYQMLSYEELVFGTNNSDVQIAITFDDVFSGFKDKVYPTLCKLNVSAMLFLTEEYTLSPREFWMNELFRLLLEGKRYKSEFLFCHPTYQYVFSTSNYQERLELYHSLKFILGGLDRHSRETCMMQVRDWVGVDCIDRKEYTSLGIEFCNEIKNNPLITFGAHTISHGILDEMDYGEQYKEIIQSKIFLEKELQKDIRHFSYPFGLYNSMTKDILSRNGFRSACCSRQGVFDENGMDLLALPRLIPPNVGKVEFEKWIGGICEKKIIHAENDFIIYVGTLKNDKMIYDKEMQCVIFGAGMFGEILLNKMNVLGMSARLIGFIDNDMRKQNKIFCGYPVFSINLLKKKRYDIYVWHYSRFILEQLKQIDAKRVHLITKV